MSQSNASLHYQLGLDNAVMWFRRSGSSKAKLMDPGVEPPLAAEFPYVKWIIRRYRSDNEAREDMMKGERGAWLAWKNFYGPWVAERPWLAEPRYILEHDNEPTNFGMLVTKKARKATAAYSKALMRIFWEEAGVRSGLFCFGVGHPEMHHVEELIVPALAEAPKYESVWCLHEYGYPTVQDGYINDFEPYHIFRYRCVVNELRRLGATDIPDLHITEWGIDGLLVGKKEGWQAVNNDAHWMVDTQVAWYDLMSRSDSYMKGFYAFTATPDHSNWSSYGWEEPHIEVLADYVRTH